MRNITLALIMMTAHISYAESDKCWLDEATVPDISQTAQLLTMQLAINLQDPSGDLGMRIAHRDYRFIAIGGYSIDYPGLSDLSLLCTHGGRLIEGTSDAIESDEHALLMQRFKKYAELYNQEMSKVSVHE
jgi:hypothetical protein